MFSEIQEEISISDNSLPESLEDKLFEEETLLKTDNLVDVFYDSFEKQNLLVMKKELKLQKKLSVINEVDKELEYSKQVQRNSSFQIVQEEGLRFIK